MNNKGFTLVELLLTIAILGLIVAVAIPSYTVITNAVKKSQRNNIIERIEIAASKYAFDTGKTSTFVDELILEGYLDGDNNGNIEDPVNSARLNCYMVKMTKEGDYYTSEFIDGFSYDDNGICDTSKLQESNQNVSINVYNNGEVITNNSTWLTGEVTLKAYSESLDIKCDNNKCNWTSNAGASSSDGEVKINIEGILNTKYTYQYTIINDVTSETKRYTASVDVKIDNESPIISNDQTIISDEFIGTSTKTVNVSASDGNGSGIEGYYLKINNGELCDNVNGYQESSVFTVSENGNYLICVKDNVGNVTKGNITINYIV